MGFGRASEMCLSGRLYPAAEAYQAGLVDALTTPDDLLPKAFAIAESIAANPDPMLRMTKQLLTANGSATDLAAVQERESVLLRECWKSAEHKEAVSAFLEKRPPRFRG
jgi:2-(1,2-epoxy-1,2-dihydrophenyl)acetyl-CoA isomerase